MKAYLHPTQTALIVIALLFWIHLPLQANDETVMRELGLDEPVVPAATMNTRRSALLVYDGAPLAVELNVGSERRLQFERPVEIGMDPALDNKLSVEIYGNNMLLTAAEPFEARVQVRDIATRKVVPIDISAYHDLSGALKQTVQVYTESPRPAFVTTTEPATQTLTRLPSALLEPRSQKPVDQVAMVRFAAQNYYAPKRLIKRLNGLSVLEIEKKPIRLYRGDVVKTTPDAAWEIGGMIVTAIKVVNKTPSTLVLDPRHLIGRWHSATFHHTVLEPKGGNDRTMVYLISNRPMAQALKPYTTINRGESL